MAPILKVVGVLSLCVALSQPSSPFPLYGCDHYDDCFVDCFDDCAECGYIRYPDEPVLPLHVIQGGPTCYRCPPLPYQVQFPLPPPSTHCGQQFGVRVEVPHTPTPCKPCLNVGYEVETPITPCVPKLPNLPVSVTVPLPKLNCHQPCHFNYEVETPVAPCAPHLSNLKTQIDRVVLPCPYSPPIMDKYVEKPEPVRCRRSTDFQDSGCDCECDDEDEDDDCVNDQPCIHRRRSPSNWRPSRNRRIELFPASRRDASPRPKLANDRISIRELDDFEEDYQDNWDDEPVFRSTGTMSSGQNGNEQRIVNTDSDSQGSEGRIESNSRSQDDSPGNGGTSDEQRIVSRNGGQNGQQRRGGTNDEQRRGGTNDEQRRGGTNDEQRRGGTNDEQRRGGTNDVQRRGGTNDVQRRGGTNDEQRRGGTNDEQRRGGTNDEQRIVSRNGGQNSQQRSGGTNDEQRIVSRNGGQNSQQRSGGTNDEQRIVSRNGGQNSQQRSGGTNDEQRIVSQNGGQADQDRIFSRDLEDTFYDYLEWNPRLSSDPVEKRWNDPNFGRPINPTDYEMDRVLIDSLLGSDGVPETGSLPTNSPIESLLGALRTEPRGGGTVRNGVSQQKRRPEGNNMQPPPNRIRLNGPSRQNTSPGRHIGSQDRITTPNTFRIASKESAGDQTQNDTQGQNGSTTQIQNGSQRNSKGQSGARTQNVAPGQTNTQSQNGDQTQNRVVGQRSPQRQRNSQSQNGSQMQRGSLTQDNSQNQGSSQAQESSRQSGSSGQGGAQQTRGGSQQSQDGAQQRPARPQRSGGSSSQNSSQRPPSSDGPQTRPGRPSQPPRNPDQRPTSNPGRNSASCTICDQRRDSTNGHNLVLSTPDGTIRVSDPAAWRPPINRRPGRMPSTLQRTPQQPNIPQTQPATGNLQQLPLSSQGDSSRIVTPSTYDEQPQYFDYTY